MTARWLAFVIWAAVAATAVFWGLRLWVVAPGAPANALAAEMGVPQRADLARLFGAEAPVAQAPVYSPQLSSRFRLLGVAAPKSSASPEGVALIAIDGKPARAFRVGGLLDNGLVLQSVHARGALLGARDGPTQVRLDLPPLPMPTTGVLAGLPPAEPPPQEALVGAPPPAPEPAEMRAPSGIEAR